MIKLKLVFILCFASVVTFGQSYSLLIYVSNVKKSDTLILHKKVGDDEVAIDTIVLKANQVSQKEYRFNTPVYLSFTMKGNNYYSRLIVNSRVTVKYDVSANETTTTGSKETTELENTDKRISDPVRKKYFELYTLIRQYAGTADSIKIDSLSTMQTSVLRNLTDSHRVYIQRNPNSLVSLYFIRWVYDKFSPTEIKNMIYSLDKKIQQHSIAKFILKKVKSDLRFDEGMIAPEFIIKDARNQVFSSKDFKNKLILLDFWGTWCGPCIASIPDLIKLKERFVHKGLVVISYAKEIKISKEDFIKFENKFNITWSSFYELSDKPTGLLKLYNIIEFPTYILIKNGIIIKRVKSESGLRSLEDIIESM